MKTTTLSRITVKNQIEAKFIVTKLTDCFGDKHDFAVEGSDVVSTMTTAELAKWIHAARE